MTSSSGAAFRLPRTVLPRNYDLTLDLDLDAFAIAGHVGIDLDVTEPVAEIAFNAAELELGEVVLRRGGEPVAIEQVTHDDATERTTLRLAEPATPGAHRLEIDYTGTINDQLHGLYRSVRRDADGTEHVIATSQCQAADARRILPCWDEPDFKATFRTTLVVPEGIEAYSNAREVGRSVADGRLRVDFAATIPMSTYLLAFIAGEFETTETVEVRGTPIRVIVPRGSVGQAGVALANAVASFDFLSDYFGIPYAGDKLDHIAVPDFPSGAMENLGLVIYRDTYVVVDEARASQSELQSCLDVIAHETSHQWFGNLVTMAWWEGIWLNEAFANLMEMKTTEHLRPEWKRWLSFANSEVPWAMSTDQLKSTRPVEFAVEAPEEADQMFDAITYGKGSAVLHMVDEFIGPEHFRSGVSDYLRDHRFGNTVTADLWAGLDGASDWPVSEILDTWVYQPGFPQIDVSRVDGGVRLAQRRYLVTPDETDRTRWKVPLQLRGVVGGVPFEQEVLLDDDEVVVPLDGEVGWLVANGGGRGFFHTRYDRDLGDRLRAGLGQLDDVERYAVVADALAFVRNGQTDASVFFDLVAGCGDEREQAVWSLLVGGLALLEHHALDEAARPGFQRYVRTLIGPALERLGWEAREGEPDLDRKLRGDLIAALGTLGGDPETIARCRPLAEAAMDGEEGDPEVSRAALTVYAREAGAEEYDRLWRAYEEATAPLDRARYLRCVASVPVDELAVGTLDKILGGEIRAQDGFWVFGSLLAGKAGPAVWRSAEERWAELLDAMPGVTRTNIVEGIASLSQPEIAGEVRTFLEAHPIREATTSVTQNLEKLGVYVRLRERETPVLGAYFA
jgi:puromycin-sensitive aminopeptidase